MAGPTQYVITGFYHFAGLVFYPLRLVDKETDPERLRELLAKIPRHVNDRNHFISCIPSNQHSTLHPVTVPYILLNKRIK